MRSRILACFALLLTPFCSQTAVAAIYTWDITPGTIGPGNGTIEDGSGQWDTLLGNWTSDGGANNIAWTNNTTDIASFGGTGSTGGIVTLSGNFAAGGIQFNGANTGSYTLSGTASPVLTLDAGGITLQSGAGAATLNNNLALVLSATQAWTNSSATNALIVNSAVSTNAAATLTITGIGNFSIGGNLSNGTGALSLTKSGGGGLLLSGSNSYTGLTTISGGAVQFAKEVSLYNNTPTSWTAANITVAGGTAAVFNVGGSGEFTATDIDTIKAIGTATTGFLSGAYLGLDTTNAGGSFTYGSVIANTNSNTNVIGLIKTGTGTLIFTGANTYTGGTIINGGTLQIGNGGTGTLPAGTITNNGALVFNSTTTQTVSGAIGGTGSLAQNGPGIVSLSGTNNYSDGTTLAGGTLNFSGTAAPAGQTVTLTNGSNTFTATALTGLVVGEPAYNAAGLATTTVITAINTGTNLVTLSNNYTGTTGSATVSFGAYSTAIGATAGAFTITGGTFNNAQNTTLTLSNNNPMNWNGDFTYTGGVGSNGTNFNLNLGTGAVTLGGNRMVTVSSTIPGQSGTLTVAGNISSGSAFGITKAGLGRLTLSGDNTYAGATTVSNGILQFARQVSLYHATTANWTPANITVASGSTLAVNVGGPGEFDSAALDTLLNAAHLGSSTVSTGLESGSAIGIDPTNASGNAFAYSSAITDINGNSIGLTKLGSNINSNITVSTLSLTGSAANTYSGMTTVYSGYLVLAKTGGVNALGGNVTIDSLSSSAGNGSSLILATSTTASNATNYIPDTSTIAFNAGTGTLTNATFSLDGNAETIAGLIGPVAVATNGSRSYPKSQLLLRGANDTTSASGTLTMNVPSGAYYFGAFQTINDTDTSHTLAFTKTGAGTQALVASSFSSHGAITISGGALQLGTKPNNANIVLNGGVLENYNDSPQGVTTNTSMNVQVGTTAGRIQWMGDGGFASYFRTPSATTTFQFSVPNSTWGTTASFLPNGARLLFGSQTSNTKVIYSGALNLGDAQRTIFVATGAANSDSSAQMASALTSTTPANGSLIKDGPGILILAGANTYSGSTTVSAGTLYLNSTNATTSISVSSNAGLGGTGSASAATVSFAANSTVAGGLGGTNNPNGTLTIPSATFAGSNTFNLPINGSGNPGLVIAQNNGFTLNGSAGTSTINLTGTLAAPANLGDVVTTHLIQYTGSIQGTGFSAFNPTPGSVPGTTRGGTFQIVNNSAQGFVDLNYSFNYIYWTGANSQNWVDAGNWKLSSDNSVTTYVEGDYVLFDDSAGANSNVVRLDTTGTSAAVVNPKAVVFNNVNIDYTLASTAPNVPNTFSAGVWNGNSPLLIKKGSGKLTVTNENQFAGTDATFGAGIACVITEGTLAVSGLNVNFQGSGSIAMNGGTLQWLSANFADPTARTHGVIPSGLIIGNGKTANLDTNGLNIEFDWAFGGNQFTNDSSSTGGVNKLGAGTLTLLCNANAKLHEAYTGGTAISGGTLSFGLSSVDLVSYTNVLTGTGAITMNGGTLQWNSSFNNTPNTTDVSTTNGIVMINGKNAIFDTNGSNVTFATAFGSATSGSLTLNDTNATPGTLTIAAGTSYSGTTTISSGTLALVSATSNNNLSTSSKIIVGDTPAHSAAKLDVTGITAPGGFHVVSGQTLGGHGTVLGAVTVDNAAAVAPGNSVGTLTFNSDLTLNGDAAFEISATGNDQIVGTNNMATLTRGGTLSVSIIGTPTFTNPETFQLFNWSGTVAATSFSGFNMGALPAGFRWHDFGTNYYFDNATGRVEVEAAVPSPPGSGSWRNGAGDGLWTTNTDANSNWVTGIPSGPDDVATFDDNVIGTPGTVKFVASGSGNRTVGGIVFNTSGISFSLGVSSSDTLTLQVTSGMASILSTSSGAGGSHAINASVVTASNASINVNNGASLTLAGGLDNSAGKVVTLTQAGSGSLTAASITNNGPGTVTVSGDVAVTGSVSGSGTTNVGTVANANASLTANRVVQTALNISRVPTMGDPSPNALVAINSSIPSSYFAPGDSVVPTGSSAGTSILNSLSIANDGAGLVVSPTGPSTYYGTLDLSNNNLVIDYTGHASPVAAIRDAIWSAYHGGDWLGKGLTSSFMAGNPGAQYALALSDNASGANQFSPFDNGGNPFDGTPVNSQSVLVKFTWQDDLNMDGTVDISDAQIFANSYDNGATGNHTFVQGDLNYDGVVDISDAQIFANAYIISPQLATLPEPSSFLLAALGLMCLAYARWRMRTRISVIST